METDPHESYHLDTLSTDVPTGASVLCLPGLFAGSWVFEGVLPLIAKRGYPASALSYRGHPPLAPMAAIGGQSVMDFARDAAAAAQGLDRPIVIGHSLGGLVAQLLAARDLVRAAVLISPAPPRGIQVLNRAILVRMLRYLPALVASRPFLPTAEHLDAMVLNRVPESERTAVRDRFVPDSGRAARQMSLGVYAIPERMRVPILVVGSDDDRFIPAEVSRRVAVKYGAPLHIAKGHGHFLFSEPGWEAEAKIILDWIDALPPAIRTGPVGAQRRSERESQVPDAGLPQSTTQHPGRT